MKKRFIKFLEKKYLSYEILDYAEVETGIIEIDVDEWFFKTNVENK